MSWVQSGDALRGAALRALGTEGDPRAREALEHGAVAIEADILAWQSSRGTIRGHRVRLELPAILLARVRASPAASAGLQGAFASAIAALSEADALADFELGWAPLAVPPSPYRDSFALPRPPLSDPIRAGEDMRAVQEALVEYLRELGLETAARAAAGATLEGTRESFVVRVRDEDAPEASSIESALVALLGARSGRVVGGAARFR